MNTKQTKELLDTLDWDVNPERDLWPDIHSNIRFSGAPRPAAAAQSELEDASNADWQASKSRIKNTPAWVSMSIAASLLLAFGAFIMSGLTYLNSLETHEMQASFIEYQKSQIGLIEQQHAHVRTQFLALLDGDLGQLDPRAVAEVKAIMLTIDDASLELKEAILAEPLNRKYASMLARTYQEELRLLNKFKSKDGQPSIEVSL